LSSQVYLFFVGQSFDHGNLVFCCLHDVFLLIVLEEKKFTFRLAFAKCALREQK